MELVFKGRYELRLQLLVGSGQLNASGQIRSLNSLIIKISEMTHFIPLPSHSQFIFLYIDIVASFIKLCRGLFSYDLVHLLSACD